MYIYKISFSVWPDFSNRQITTFKVLKETDNEFICRGYDDPDMTFRVSKEYMDKLSVDKIENNFGILVSAFCTKAGLTKLETKMNNYINQHIRDILKKINKIAYQVAEDFSLINGHYNYRQKTAKNKKRKS